MTVYKDHAFTAKESKVISKYWAKNGHTVLEVLKNVDKDENGFVIPYTICIAKS